MARTDQPHKLTFDAFVAKSTDFSDPVNEKHRELDYSRSESRARWNGSKVKIPIWCRVHGEFFEQQPANHMNGQGCPKCGKDVYKAKRRKADPIADFREVHGDKYDYSRVIYENVQTQIEIVCPAHGSFFQKPNSHLTGQGCPACWENRRKAFGKSKTEDYRATFAERAARVHGGAYALLSLPENSHDTVKLNCPKHGDFEQKAFSHLDGHGCWQCGQSTNHAQLEMASFIEALGVKIEHENKTVLGGLHIDIWAPDQRIGIEYHGAFWHTEDRVGNKHREKYERATAAGARLVQVFDFEWLERRSAVENRLRALFGGGEVFAARKCGLREVPVGEARTFLRAFHTQGPGLNPEVVYGLYEGPRLVACMSFGRGRFKSAGWELLRYASTGRVQGGFSRLLAAFVQEHQPETLRSYCDLRWGDGGVYLANGFVLDGVTPPDYWYVDKRGKRQSRQTVWDRPKGVSEQDWVAKLGYLKVLGVGHQRWLLTTPRQDPPPSATVASA